MTANVEVFISFVSHAVLDLLFMGRESRPRIARLFAETQVKLGRCAASLTEE